jgi:hypothetical protein
MEPGDSSPHSHKPSIGPYPEPDRSNPYHPNLPLEDPYYRSKYDFLIENMKQLISESVALPHIPKGRGALSQVAHSSSPPDCLLYAYQVSFQSPD